MHAATATCMHACMISDQVPFCNHGREMFGQSQVYNSSPASMQA